jgi:hypothetical protein
VRWLRVGVLPQPRQCQEEETKIGEDAEAISPRKPLPKVEWILIESLAESASKQLSRIA